MMEKEYFGVCIILKLQKQLVSNWDNNIRSNNPNSNLGDILRIGWRICKEAVPVKGESLRQRVRLDTLCPRCEEEVETVSHTLWICDSTSMAWAIFRVPPWLLLLPAGVSQKNGESHFRRRLVEATRIHDKGSRVGFAIRLSGQSASS
ncbi:hypothetical protein LguiB_031688 [Lonicera macranthoides]